MCLLSEPTCLGGSILGVIEVVLFSRGIVGKTDPQRGFTEFMEQQNVKLDSKVMQIEFQCRGRRECSLGLIWS